MNLICPDSAAENRAAALEQTLSIFQDDNPNVVEHMKAEADALEKLSEVRSQLEKYQAVYGDPSTLPPDISVLARQLQQKEEEIKRLRLLENYHNQVSSLQRRPFPLLIVPGGDFTVCGTGQTLSCLGNAGSSSQEQSF